MGLTRCRTSRSTTSPLECAHSEGALWVQSATSGASPPPGPHPPRDAVEETVLRGYEADLRSAPLLFYAAADALEWAVKESRFEHVYHYIDDRPRPAWQR